GQPGDAASPGRPGEEAHLHQVGFADVLQGDALLPQGRGQGLQTHRAAAVHFNDGPQQAAVQLVQAQLVNVHLDPGVDGGFRVDGAVSPDGGKVPGALEQAVGDTGGAAAAPGQFQGALMGGGDAQDGGAAFNDAGQLVGTVGFQFEQDAEAVPQGAG